MGFSWNSPEGFLGSKDCMAQGSCDGVEVYWGVILCYALDMRRIIKTIAKVVTEIKYHFVLCKAQANIMSS
jgi:hypothetical protein